MANQFIYSGELRSSKPLTARDIHKEFGEHIILLRESISIDPEDKIGLVGKNGTGKSTLIRILVGLERPDSGKVINSDLKIGYLPQDYTLDAGKTVYEVATEGVLHLAEALEEFDHLSTNYANNAEFETRYAYLLELLQKNEAFDLPGKVRTLLTHLGVTRDFDAKVATLSGGQTVRLALARILISKPDILLLDEPTNHLDLRGILWLREFLNEWQGGFLVVSHDRNFLDEITTSTWELEEGKIKRFGGNYSFYREQKQLDEEVRQREAVRLAVEIKRAKRKTEKERERAAHSARHDISRNSQDHDRFRAGFFKGKAEKTAGKKKRLSEDKESQLRGKLEHIEHKASPKIAPRIQESEAHRGKLLVLAKNMSCSYGDEKILEDVNLNIHFGDRVALFGRNGAGKTTFVNGLTNRGNVIVEGKLETVSDINIQILDQSYSSVDRNKTVLENIQRLAPATNTNNLRQYLARFLFRETAEVDKPAQFLSGGEIARLALAIMLLRPVDLLVLDEPTNNLDVNSIEEIESVLAEFKGAILIVSHDISFLENIGVSYSYVVADRKVRLLETNPVDGKDFEQEVSLFL